jgi:predicted phosphodiesterase
VPYLILSDIHSNLEALTAVLSDAQGLYDKILCLGDLVGYGADPNPVVAWARENVATIVRGNHDRACCGLDDLEDYNPAARLSAIWTRRAISEETRTYLEQMPQGPVRVEDFDLAHGSPFDEDEYLVNISDLAPHRSEIEATLTFFGHTHVQGGFIVSPRGPMHHVSDATFELDPKNKYLINPGSVGQPRDRDPRAAYAIYTHEARTIEYRRTDYDISAAATKIMTAGLPQILAARLFEGV